MLFIVAHPHIIRHIWLRVCHSTPINTRLLSAGLLLHYSWGREVYIAVSSLQSRATQRRLGVHWYDLSIVLCCCCNHDFDISAISVQRSTQEAKISRRFLAMRYCIAPPAHLLATFCPEPPCAVHLQFHLLSYYSGCESSRLIAALYPCTVQTGPRERGNSSTIANAA